MKIEVEKDCIWIKYVVFYVKEIMKRYIFIMVFVFLKEGFWIVNIVIVW